MGVSDAVPAYNRGNGWIEGGAHTCFPPVQAVKKKKAGITPEQYRTTRSYDMARNKGCLVMKEL